MPQEHATLIAALLGSRICHDLISPIGAISNGVELLGLSGQTDSSELSLISDSVANANARVKLFRIAFGQASAGQMTGAAEMRSICKALATNRLSYDWGVEGDQSREEVKLACLMMMCIETAMPRGGVIQVGHHDGQWTVLARAERLEPDPTLWARLGAITEVETLKPSQVQFVLAPLQADLIRRRIKHGEQDGVLVLQA